LAFNCAQCGGTLELAVGTRFAPCPFCGSSVYFDRSKAVLHYVAAPTLDEATARARLQAWMAGNETVKNLENDAVVGAATLSYFPLWRFVSGQGPDERQSFEPARASAAAGLTDVPLSGGALRHVSAQDRERLPLAEPEVQLESAVAWLTATGVSPAAIRETTLVHIPLFEFPYAWGGKSWKAAVDGVSGRVLVGAYPAKSETAYVGIAAIGIGGFFLLGLLSPNIFIRFALFLVASVPLGLAALAITRKV